jgi:hypothetical protein
MKRLSTALLIAALAAAGCAEESEPGGAGADPAPRANGNGNEMQNEENTFTITPPAAATNIQAGGSQAVTIDVNREDQFKEAVTLKFTAPPGVKVEPANQEVAAGVDSVDVTITVEPTARAGEQTIQVTATPASGKNPVKDEFQIEVEAAENGGAPRGPATDPAADPAQPAQPTQP